MAETPTKEKQSELRKELEEVIASKNMALEIKDYQLAFEHRKKELLIKESLGSHRPKKLEQEELN